METYFAYQISNFITSIDNVRKKKKDSLKDNVHICYFKKFSIAIRKSLATLSKISFVIHVMNSSSMKSPALTFSPNDVK